MNYYDLTLLYKQGRKDKFLSVRNAILEFAGSKNSSANQQIAENSGRMAAEDSIENQILATENQHLKAAILETASSFSQTENSIANVPKQTLSFFDDLRTRFGALTQKISSPWLAGAVAVCSVSIIALTLVFNQHQPPIQSANKFLISYATEHLPSVANKSELPQVNESLGFSAVSNPQTTGIEYGALFTLNNRLKDRNKIIAYIQRFMFFSQNSPYEDKASALLQIYRQNAADNELNAELQKYYLVEIDSDEKAFIGYWISILSLSANQQADSTNHLMTLISEHQNQFVDSLVGYISSEQQLEFKDAINRLAKSQDVNDFDYRVLNTSLNKLKVWLGIL